MQPFYFHDTAVSMLRANALRQDLSIEQFVFENTTCFRTYCSLGLAQASADMSPQVPPPCLHVLELTRFEVWWHMFALGW